MKEEIIISGFGGQGVLSMGKLIAYAGIHDGKNVTWLPSYGAEQRGGTANVTVIVSDEKISSPILNTCETAILLNQPSLDRFLSHIRPGGTLIYDTFGITHRPERSDIHIYEINAMDTAARMSNAKVFNMLILGGLLKVRPFVSVDNICQALYKTLPERHHALIPLNMEALHKGMEIIRPVP